MAANSKFVIRQQGCTLTKEELKAFLADYPIPKQFKIMLPSKRQGIYDAPKNYVGFYTHAFTTSNLRIPLHPLILELLQYYEVHISRFNPFGLAKLTTYIVMCKAYGFEPSLTVLRGFLNLYPGGDWLTLAKRGECDVPILIEKPFTNIRNWKGKFFYIQDTIVPPQYPALLNPEFQFDEKRFNDPLPYTVRRDPLYQRLSCHPADCQNFPEPVLFMAGIAEIWEGSPLHPEIMCCGEKMSFRNFVVAGGAKEVSFIPKEAKEVSYGVGSPSISVNNNDVDAQQIEPVSSAPPTDWLPNGQV